MSLVPEHIKELAPYIPGKTIESVKDEYKLESIIKLASNENPLGPSLKSIEVIKRNLLGINRYPDSSGHKLRQKLAEKFKLKIDNVVLGAGSEGVMSSIMRTFLKQTDEIIGTENSFIGFRVLANASGKKVLWLPMKNDKYDLEKISDNVNDKTKIIYLANPDNPMGTYFNIKDFDMFMSRIPSRVLVILDEAYFEYAQFIKDYPDSMFYRYDNVITLRTFSKIYGLAGLRIGYGFAHEDLIANLMKVKLPFEPSILAQAAAIAALEDEKHLNESVKINREGMKYLYHEFNKLNINYIDSVTNFITIKFSSVTLTKKCALFLLKNGVIVRELKGFGLPLYIRISIGTMNENRTLVKMLKNFLGSI